MSKTQHAQMLNAYLEELCEEPPASPVVPWVQWARSRVGLPLAVGLALTVAGCGGTASRADSVGEGDCSGDSCAEQCRDGLDNDQDGRIDCDDPDCRLDSWCLGAGGSAGSTSGGSAGASTGGSAGSTSGGSAGASTGGSGGIIGTVYGIPLESDCNDEMDNDADGLIDCLDPDCYSNVMCAAVPYGLPYESECADGTDDDGDGLVDCADPDCYASAFCGQPEYAMPMETLCADGQDDDGDGLIDCADPDCEADPSCPRGDVPLYAMPF